MESKSLFYLFYPWLICLKNIDQQQYCYIGCGPFQDDGHN